MYRKRISRRNRGILALVTGVAVLIGVAVWNGALLPVQAEQVGSSPESGADSRLRQAFDWLGDQGANYGDTASADWSNDWGSMWNRIMASAAWKPDGTASAADVKLGKTFYAGSRGVQTGTLDTSVYANDELLQNLDTQTYYSDTNGYGTWTQVAASGGTAASVSANGTTLTLASTRVMRDDRTGLLWTDSTSSRASNNQFTWVSGDSRTNPTGNSCNFNATGNANQWCNVSNFSSPDYNNPANNVQPGDQPKTGVSASEFCLNLSADDGNGVKTDWRVPTQRELMLAYLDGSRDNLPNSGRSFWASTEYESNKTLAWFVDLGTGYTTNGTKSFTGYYTRCVRG